MPKHAYTLRPERLDQLHIVAIGEALRGQPGRRTFPTTSEIIRAALHVAARFAHEGALLNVVREPSPFRSKLPGLAASSPETAQ